MDKETVKALATAASAGTTMLCCIGGFVWIGYELDAWLGTEPAFMSVLGIIGAVTGMYSMYKRVK